MWPCVLSVWTPCRLDNNVCITFPLTLPIHFEKRLKFESAYVRVRPRKFANVRLRTVRLRTDADFRGLRVSAKVRESPLLSLGLVWTFDSPRQSAKVREQN